MFSHWAMSDSATPWAACQAPLSMGFSRQEYWSGVPCPSPGESPWPRDRMYASCLGRRILYHWAIWENANTRVPVPPVPPPHHRPPISGNAHSSFPRLPPQTSRLYPSWALTDQLPWAHQYCRVCLASHCLYQYNIPGPRQLSLSLIIAKAFLSLSQYGSWWIIYLSIYLPSLVAQLVKNPVMQETPVWFLGGEDPLEKG